MRRRPRRRRRVRDYQQRTWGDSVRAPQNLDTPKNSRLPLPVETPGRRMTGATLGNMLATVNGPTVA